LSFNVVYTNVYYVVYADDACGHRASEIDFAVKRLVRELLHSLSDGGGINSKFWPSSPPSCDSSRISMTRCFECCCPLSGGCCRPTSRTRALAIFSTTSG
ncbi:unnamed protein product, partial [Ectocarpus sp. 8 AP-2014]